MERITPHLESTTGAHWLVAAGTTGTELARLPFAATSGPRCIRSSGYAPDGTYYEIEWPDVMRRGITLPPGPGKWRHDGERWQPFDPATEAHLLIETRPDPDHVRIARLEQQLAALTKAQAPATTSKP